MDPNLLAYLAVLSWPVVALLLYKSLTPTQATLWTVLGAELLLPVGTSMKIPMIPAIDKTSVATLAALLGCLLFARRGPGRAGRSGLVVLLAALFVLGPVVTSLLNNDTIVVGDRILPGVGVYDGVSAFMTQVIFIIPYFLGRNYLRGDADLSSIMRTLVVAGLVYSVPMLFEVRFSPQLHTWIYGYFPHEFLQQMRGDGFRPVVFMGHGLLVALFSATSLIAAMALWRARRQVGPLPPAGVAAYLGVVLVLCKSAGAFTYALAAAPLVRLATPRAQVRVAVVLATIAISYPVLRSFDVFPTAAFLDVASSFSSERSESLEFRFENESTLLEHASDRFWFGWGRYGRNRVYDDDTGKELTVTDGRWIITLGSFGLLGFLAEFGLLVIPIFGAAAALRFASSREDAIYLAALALIMAVWVIDQLPNASLSPWSWLLAGALLGRAEALRAGEKGRLPGRPSPIVREAHAATEFRFK